MTQFMSQCESLPCERSVLVDANIATLPSPNQDAINLLEVHPANLDAKRQTQVKNVNLGRCLKMAGQSKSQSYWLADCLSRSFLHTKSMKLRMSCFPSSESWLVIRTFNLILSIELLSSPTRFDRLMPKNLASLFKDSIVG